MARVVLTAGFDGAEHVLALAELAVRDGHEIAAVLVVSPFRLARFRQLVRQRGLGATLRTARRLVGARRESGALPDPMEAFRSEHGLTARSLKAWSREHRVEYVHVPDLNDPRAIAAVQAASADAVLYGGGGILRTAFLEAARGRVVNAHSGPLPAIRGMNACEWSIVLGLEPCVTIHVVDRGIDTGATIDRLPLPIERQDTIDRLRAKCAVLGVVGMQRALPKITGPLPSSSGDAASHPQCYVMAQAIHELAERRLAQRLP